MGTGHGREAVGDGAGGMPHVDPLTRSMDFIRSRTALAPVPLVPEIELYQATELTELWRATSADLAGWDDSPFWAFPWAGGQALARLVLDQPASGGPTSAREAASSPSPPPSRAPPP
jgi:hypothetical protein